MVPSLRISLNRHEREKQWGPRWSPPGPGRFQEAGPPARDGKVSQVQVAGWVVNPGPRALLVFKPRFPHLPNRDVQGTVV